MNPKELGRLADFVTIGALSGWCLGVLAWWFTRKP
jgi:hypothetical protein